MCRICEITAIMEEANSGENAFAELEDHTFEQTMEGLYKDDVYHFLLRKYRDKAVMEMSDEKYNEMTTAMEEAGQSAASVPGEEELDRIIQKADKQLH